MRNLKAEVKAAAAAAADPLQTALIKLFFLFSLLLLLRSPPLESHLKILG